MYRQIEEDEKDTKEKEMNIIKGRIGINRNTVEVYCRFRSKIIQSIIT